MTPLCDVDEISTFLKVPKATIYHWVHHRKIPFIKVGRHLRFDLEDVLQTFRDKGRVTEAISESDPIKGGLDRVEQTLDCALEVVQNAPDPAIVFGGTR